MDKITKTKHILKSVGMPQKQQSDLCALVLLALSNVRKDVAWKAATNEWMRIHDMILFVNNNYGKDYAENSRETFRKQVLHHFLRLPS